MIQIWYNATVIQWHAVMYNHSKHCSFILDIASELYCPMTSTLETVDLPKVNITTVWRYTQLNNNVYTWLETSFHPRNRGVWNRKSFFFFFFRYNDWKSLEFWYQKLSSMKISYLFWCQDSLEILSIQCWKSWAPGVPLKISSFRLWNWDW